MAATASDKLVPSPAMSLQTLYGRPGFLHTGSTRRSRAPAHLTPEIAARLDEALQARPAEDLPSTHARRMYELLVAHGFDRSDILAIAGSLVDLVASDVSVPETSV